MREATARKIRMLAGLFFWAATALGAERSSPYLVSKEQLQTTIRTIALRPVVLPAGTEDAEALTQRIEQLIVDKLAAKGFQTVSASAFAQVWRQLAERSGGVFNAVTGEPDKKKLEAVRDHTLRELARLHHIDAVIVPTVYLDSWIPGIRLGLPGYYYAADEAVVWHGQPLRDVPAFRPQKVIGSHLGISLMDLSAVRTYGMSAYIELTKVYIARGYEEKPRSQLYRTDRLQRAVNAALDPLFSVEKNTQP